MPVNEGEVEELDRINSRSKELNDPNNTNQPKVGLEPEGNKNPNDDKKEKKPNLVYRGGSYTAKTFTPRPGQDDNWYDVNGGLSTFKNQKPLRQMRETSTSNKC